MTFLHAEASPCRLYCLMRTDLASLNAGKAMAQAMHAQAMAEREIAGGLWKGHWMAEWVHWKAETRDGFGTTIVLACAVADMQRRMAAGRFMGLPCGVVHDPTYPLADGDVTHLIPLDTCGWAFGPPDILAPVIGELDLHP